MCHNPAESSGILEKSRNMPFLTSQIRPAYSQGFRDAYEKSNGYGYAVQILLFSQINTSAHALLHPTSIKVFLAWEMILAGIMMMRIITVRRRRLCASPLIGTSSASHR